MLAILKPDMVVNSLDSVSILNLCERGIKALVIDLDNTVTPWNAMEVGPKVTSWFKTLDENGIRCCVASNNSEQRVAVVAQSLGIPFIYRADKPRRRSFLRAMSMMESEVKDTAVIGDQIFTDMLGGNRLGMFTILVLPISKREWIGTRIVRFFERAVLWTFRITGGIARSGNEH